MMPAPTPTAAARQQALRNTAPFLSAFKAQVLVTRLDALPGGRVVPRTQDWTAYWRPVYWLGDAQIDDALRKLATAWREYIASGFCPALRRQYCLRYFSLLDLVLAAASDSMRPLLWRRALRAVVSFECFSISGESPNTNAAAAGTTTLRNPCYLLAKLKWPDVPDDTRFLPLISVADDEAGGLFGHYRQYRPSEGPAMPILVYLPSAAARRSTSLRLTDLVAKAVDSAGDPFVRDRASRLWTHALRPIVRTAVLHPLGHLRVEFLDVGAGTGALTVALCRRLLAWSRATGVRPRFRLWLVDLYPSDPARLFRTPPLRRYMDSILFLSSNYRTWLGQPKPLPATSGLRVALASKVFDMSSHMSACHFRTDVLASLGMDPSWFGGKRHLPAHCLAPGGPGPEALLVSSSRMAVEEGHTYPQASLSEFYRALRLASCPDSATEAEEDGLWLPLRAFDPECLTTSDRASVLGRLLEHCDYLIVEDADLRPKDLLDHLRAFSLRALAAYDLTKVMRLTGNYAYVLWPNKSQEPDLGGERLW